MVVWRDVRWYFIGQSPNTRKSVRYTDEIWYVSAKLIEKDVNCKSLVKLLSCRAKLNKCDIHQNLKWTCLHIHCHAPNHIQALFFISYSSAVLLGLSLLQLIIKAPNVYVIGKINISIYPEAPLFQGHSSTGEIWRRRRRRPRREGRTPGHSRRVRGVTGGPVRTRSFGSSLRSTGRRTGTPLPRSWRGDQVGFCTSISALLVSPFSETHAIHDETKVCAPYALFSCSCACLLPWEVLDNIRLISKVDWLI